MEIIVNEKKLFVTPTGIKTTSRGKVLSPAEVIVPLPKNERRKIRKILRRNGYHKHVQRSLVP